MIIHAGLLAVFYAIAMRCFVDAYIPPSDLVTEPDVTNSTESETDEQLFGPDEEPTCGTTEQPVFNTTDKSAHLTNLWPNGVVPYSFQSTFDSNDRKAFYVAVSQIQRVTCIRDRYIIVNWGNIVRSSHSQYRKCRSCSTLGLPYDCRSVMHYTSRSFSIGGRPTMTARDPSRCELKRHTDRLTSVDIAMVNKMYNCRSKPSSGKCESKRGTIKDVDCCTKSNKCKLGQGDCDSDDDCEGSLVCGRDNCKRYYAWAYRLCDCCTQNRCDRKVGTIADSDCCTPQSKCRLGQGDCDSDADCEGNLVCGTNNCRSFYSGAYHLCDCCTRKK